MTPTAIDINLPAKKVHTTDGATIDTIDLTTEEGRAAISNILDNALVLGWGQTEKLRRLVKDYRLMWPNRYYDVQGAGRFHYPGCGTDAGAYHIGASTEVERTFKLWQALPLPKVEQRLLEATGFINGLDLEVDQQRLQEALPSLDEEERNVIDQLNEGWQLSLDTHHTVETARARLQALTGLRCAEVDRTEPQAYLDPHVSQALALIKTLSSLRKGRERIRKLSQQATTPFNYRYAASPTLRWSSPKSSQLEQAENLLAIPKSYRPVAEPIRSSISLPQSCVFVAGDLSQVDYRALGHLSGCKHICNLYENDPHADPYISYWQGMTGQRLTKDSPERKVAKAQVLSAMYLQGIRGTCDRMVQSGVSEEQAAEICEARGWRYSDVQAECQRAEEAGHTTAHQTLVAHARQGFNNLHKEIMQLVEALENLLIRLCNTRHPEDVMQTLHLDRRIPKTIGLAVSRSSDDRLDIRMRLGKAEPGWNYPSLKWMSVEDSGRGLTFLKDGRRKRLTKNIIANNLGQTYARQVTVKGTLELEDKADFPLMTPAIHDQLLVICHEDNADKAASLLRETFDPHKTWWAAIPPSDIQICPTLDIQ